MSLCSQAWTGEGVWQSFSFILVKNPLARQQCKGIWFWDVPAAPKSSRQQTWWTKTGPGGDKGGSRRRLSRRGRNVLVVRNLFRNAVFLPIFTPPGEEEHLSSTAQHIHLKHEGHEVNPPKFEEGEVGQTPAQHLSPLRASPKPANEACDSSLGHRHQCGPTRQVRWPVLAARAQQAQLVGRETSCGVEVLEQLLPPHRPMILQP